MTPQSAGDYLTQLKDQVADMRVYIAALRDKIDAEARITPAWSSAEDLVQTAKAIAARYGGDAPVAPRHWEA